MTEGKIITHNLFFLSIEDHENDNEDVQTASPEFIVPSTEQQSLLSSSSVPSNVSQSVEAKTSTIEKPSTRPAILLKRIPLNEAEQYLPAAYRIRKEYHCSIQENKTDFSFLQRNPNVVENVKIKIQQLLSLIRRKRKTTFQSLKHHQLRLKVRL